MKYIVLIAALLATPLQAQQKQCGPRGSLIMQLVGKYGEVLLGQGLRSNTQYLEIWTSPDTDSWTVTIADADGITCVMAAGQNWQTNPRFIEESKPGDKT